MALVLFVWFVFASGFLGHYAYFVLTHCGSFALYIYTYLEKKKKLSHFAHKCMTTILASTDQTIKRGQGFCNHSDLGSGQSIYNGRPVTSSFLSIIYANLF